MGETATVAEVVDGDTLAVRLADGTEETVRVVGIDTPETRDYAEEVVLENESGSPLDLSGWAVEDESGKRFEFPEGTTVPADGTVRLRTGDGTDAAVVHWPRSASVWNDDGDTVSVFDEADELVGERSY